MSLNSIKFETTDIAALFKNSLVEIDEKKLASPKAGEKMISVNAGQTTHGWRYLGENKKKTLIVVHYADEVYLPDKQLTFLTKLLAACNLNLADVAIMNFHDKQSAQFNDIINFFEPRSVLLFNVNPATFGMPMNFPEYQVQAYKDARFVFSPALETIEPDKNLKAKLWGCLKKIYNL